MIPLIVPVCSHARTPRFPQLPEKNGGDDGTRNVARSGWADENAQVADSTGDLEPLKTEIRGSSAQAGYKKSTGADRAPRVISLEFCCANPPKNSAESKQGTHRDFGVWSASRSDSQSGR